MFALKRPPSGTKAELHSALGEQARALLEGERDLTANAANLYYLIKRYGQGNTLISVVN